MPARITLIMSGEEYSREVLGSIEVNGD